METYLSLHIDFFDCSEGFCVCLGGLCVSSFLLSFHLSILNRSPYVAQASLEVMSAIPASAFHFVPGLQSYDTIPPTSLHFEHLYF